MDINTTEDGVLLDDMPVRIQSLNFLNKGTQSSTSKKHGVLKASEAARSQRSQVQQGKGLAQSMTNSRQNIRKLVKGGFIIWIQGLKSSATGHHVHVLWFLQELSVHVNSAPTCVSCSHSLISVSIRVCSWKASTKTLADQFVAKRAGVIVVAC